MDKRIGRFRGKEKEERRKEKGEKRKEKREREKRYQKSYLNDRRDNSFLNCSFPGEREGEEKREKRGGG